MAPYLQQFSVVVRKMHYLGQICIIFEQIYAGSTPSKVLIGINLVSIIRIKERNIFDAHLAFFWFN